MYSIYIYENYTIIILYYTLYIVYKYYNIYIFIQDFLKILFTLLRIYFCE